MEVINNFHCTIYARSDDIGLDDRGQFVVWQVQTRVTRFPRMIAEMSSVPFIFSPNFSYQIDFEYNTKQFLIRDTESQDMFLKVPGDLIKMSFGDVPSRTAAIKIIFSRMRWESERVLRVVNESNMDCLLEIVDGGSGNRRLKLLSAVKVDNLWENHFRLDSRHLLSDRKSLAPRDVLARLIRRTQKYKTNLLHSINTRGLPLDFARFDPVADLYSIDFD